MHTKRYHSAKMFLFGTLLFASWVMTTVIATTMIDSSTESRANAIWNSIQSNANKMQTSDVVAYYQLVRLNIKSLTQVLGIVDAKLLQEISTASLPTDTGIIDEVTKTWALPPKTTNPTPAPSTPVVNNSCQVGSVTWSPGSTRCEGTTAMICENKTWKANPNSTQCGWSVPPTPAPNPVTPPVTSAPNPGNNSNVGYLVTRQHAAEFCKIKFYNPAFTTINSNIPKSVDTSCTTWRCLISKFNWVTAGNIIYEDREDYWGRDGWIVDNIRCTWDNSTTQVDPANTYVKNKTQKCVESEKAYYWFDSNNQKTDLIKKCSTPPNGGLSCSESAGWCCPEWQTAINGQCITPANEWQACYATSGCQTGLSCTDNICRPAKVVKYSWESSGISNCACDYKSEFGGTQTETYVCKGDDGSTAFGSQCGDPKPSKSNVCTMQTSCSFYDNLSISYPQSSVVEGEWIALASAKIQKCLGTNCTTIDIPKLDLNWNMDMVMWSQRYNGDNMMFVNNKLYWFVWSKADNLGGVDMKTGDMTSYDMWDFFAGRRELIVGVKVKDSAKYPSRNPLQYETTIDVKNRFDARLTKTQSLFQGYGVSRIFIELLGEDGYNEPGNAGLYNFHGACGVTSSNPNIMPTIEFLDVNNYPLSTSASSLPGSRFKVKWLENAPSGTKIDILCTISDPKTNTTRTLTLSETK